MQHLKRFNEDIIDFEDEKKDDTEIFTEINDILVELKDIVNKAVVARTLYNSKSEKYLYLIKAEQEFSASNINDIKNTSDMISNEYVSVYERLESAGYIIKESYLSSNYVNKSKLSIKFDIKLSKGDFMSK